MKDYSVFVKALEESKKAVWTVAEKLTVDGFEVKILPSTTTPDTKSRMKHTDYGDIELIQRIEVKHRPTMDFKSIDDLPYPDIIVDECYKIDKFNINTLFGYIILNASKTYGMIILKNTRKYWFKETKFDSKEQSNRDFYMCPKKYIKLIKM